MKHRRGVIIYYCHSCSWFNHPILPCTAPNRQDGCCTVGNDRDGNQSRARIAPKYSEELGEEFGCPPLRGKERIMKLMKLLCRCGKYFEVNVYQELCPTCSILRRKALAKLHGMIFR